MSIINIVTLRHRYSEEAHAVDDGVGVAVGNRVEQHAHESTCVGGVKGLLSLADDLTTKGNRTGCHVSTLQGKISNRGL